MKLMRITPMLPVTNLAGSIEFYQKLGFVIERRQDDWGWAMLRFDDCRLMLDRSIRSHAPAPRDTVIYLYVDDIANYHQQVRAAGVDAPAPSVTFYGLTEFRIDDPDGNRLWIGQAAS